MALIAVDFDHTLVHGKDPIPGAKEAMNILRERGHKILIHSCNNPKWIERVLNDNDIRYDHIYTYSQGDGKPICDLYIDDKGYHFQGNWPSEVEDILARVEGFDNRKDPTGKTPSELHAMRDPR